MMESDDESFHITQDSFGKNVDVDESDFDPDFWSGLTMTLTRHKTKRKTTMESKKKRVRAHVKLPWSVTRI